MNHVPAARKAVQSIFSCAALLLSINVSRVMAAEDLFGITMLHESKEGGRSWNSKALLEKTFSTDWDDSHSYDAGFYLRGNAQYSSSGNGELKAGQLDGESNPRMYIGDGTTAWDGNLEVTFYSKVQTVMAMSDAAWGGLESVVRTQHVPDDEDCNTRGYGARLTLDGDCDIEKEQCHRLGANSQSTKAYPWGNSGRVPLDKWIGHKFVVRDTGNGSCVHLELYFDTTSNGDLANQKWDKVIDYVDYDGKQWESQSSQWCCSTHKDKSLRGQNSTSQLFVYLRSDAVDPQYFKWISVREIYPQGGQVAVQATPSNPVVNSPVKAEVLNGRLRLHGTGKNGVFVESITVTDMRGRTMFTLNNLAIGPEPLSIKESGNGFTDGIYTVQITCNGRIFSQKVIVAHPANNGK
jgi:hypothetical protein